MNPPSTPSPSIPTLLRELRDDTSTLLRQEITLVRSELKENVSRAGHHATQIAVGGFVSLAGLIVLLIGIGHLFGAVLTRAGVDPQLAQWVAPSVVGLVVAIIGWTMLAKAKKAFAHDDLAPRQTIDSLRDHQQWAQNKLHHSS